MLGQEFGGPPGQIARIDRQVIGALAEDVERHHVRSPHSHLVEQRHGMEHRRELVIAVVAQVTDRQEQIDLAGHAHCHRTRGHPIGGGVAI